MFLYIKATHIVAVVAWFAGLFYIVRLFVYLAETQDRPEAERKILLPQLELMAWRLWYVITWPAGLAAVAAGSSLLWWYWPAPTWLCWKLGFVTLLIGYHLMCHRYLHQLLAGERPLTGRGFRIWNEGATVLLVAIVFLVVLKSALNMVLGVVGLVALTAALMLGIRVYRGLRRA